MPYPELASGGFICYGEYPNIQHNLKALEDVWDYSYDRVPYYGTNTPIDECYECGFTGEFNCTSKGFVCPKCGNHDSAKVSVTRVFAVISAVLMLAHSMRVNRKK